MKCSTCSREAIIHKTAHYEGVQYRIAVCHKCIDKLFTSLLDSIDIGRFKQVLEKFGNIIESCSQKK